MSLISFSYTKYQENLAENLAKKEKMVYLDLEVTNRLVYIIFGNYRMTKEEVQNLYIAYHGKNGSYSDLTDYNNVSLFPDKYERRTLFSLVMELLTITKNSSYNNILVPLTLVPRFHKKRVIPENSSDSLLRLSPQDSIEYYQKISRPLKITWDSIIGYKRLDNRPPPSFLEH